MQGVPPLEVPASRHYQDLTELREKRLSGLSFEELSEADRYELAFATACVRTTLLAFYRRDWF